MADIPDLEKWKKAGIITRKALDHGLSLIRKGNSLLNVAEEVDKRITELGGSPSFPTQISMNDIAAHYCPDSEDQSVFDDQVVKLDVGASYDGFLGDSAETIDLSGNYSSLTNASKKALNEAIKASTPGVTLSEIGSIIQESIGSYGFSPIVNLSGHGLARNEVHADPTIPNYANSDTTRLQEGQVIAIEPFATNGSGSIFESSNPTVFMEITKRPIRSPETRKILEHIQGYHGLPFAKRWLSRQFPAFRVNMALKELTIAGIIRAFPPLVEKSHGIITQFEHTVIVGEKPIVLTAEE
ncbi:type II methionyl aminopeptidase [Candidatus Woesearchaeota archaeon]|nr:type II methionyl aminopeptidase [Candidatus Woesearchaeota archaeon]